MDRDRRRFDGGNFDPNENRFNEEQFPNRFVPQPNQFDQPFVPPAPNPIRRSNYQSPQQFQGQPNNGFQPGINNPQGMPQNQAYPTQPMQFSAQYQQNQPFNNDQQFGYVVDYDNAAQIPMQQQPMQSEVKRKRGLFGFMGKKEEPQVPTGNNNVVISYPKSFTDINMIIEKLRSGQSVIVDFARIDEPSSQRALDNLMGAICALHGSYQRIGARMWLFTPDGVTIQGPVDLKRKFDK